MPNKRVVRSTMWHCSKTLRISNQGRYAVIKNYKNDRFTENNDGSKTLYSLYRTPYKY